MKLSTLFIYVFSILPQTDQLIPEQIATDYFFENIFEQDFKDFRVIEFNTITETEGYFGVIINCDNNHNLHMQLEELPTGKPVMVNADKCTVKVRKVKKNSNRLSIDVKSRKTLNEQTFVYLTAYRRYRFVQHYIFTFNKAGTEILDVCNVGEII